MIFNILLCSAVLAAAYADGPGPVVPPSEDSCAKKENEYFINGGPDCQQTCKDLFKVCDVNHVAPVLDCFCKPGYARTTAGVCKALSDKECYKEVDLSYLFHRGPGGGHGGIHGGIHGRGHHEHDTCPSGA